MTPNPWVLLFGMQIANSIFSFFSYDLCNCTCNLDGGTVLVSMILFSVVWIRLDSDKNLEGYVFLQVSL